MLMNTLPAIIKYHEKKMQSLRISDPERAKYTRVLNHMQVVAKARICIKGEQCKQGGGSRRCCESHDITEALSFNPLAMTLTCPTPKKSRDDLIHKNGLCLFYHGDTAVPKSFRDTKQLLCADLDNCVDDTCLKSHSVVEVCWFFPKFRTKNCHHGDTRSQMQNCSLFHSEYHEKRNILMNSVVGKTEPVQFISRALLELTRFQEGTKQLQNRENRDGTSVTSCNPSDESQKLSRTPLVDTDDTAVDSDASAIWSSQDGSKYMLQYEMALNKCPDDERTKYEQVLAHMRLVPKSRMCSKIEDHDGASEMETCTESHTRMEALGFNPLAMVLKCPIAVDNPEGSDHRQSLCVFDHDDGDIPKGFIKDKMLLCEAFDICDNANCVKSHSFAEVCWFNPQFRVVDCPRGSMCPCKENCIGFHPEHLIRRDARMNGQVGTTEMAMFVERVHAALMKRRRNQAFSRTHPILAAEPATANQEVIQEHETAGTARAFENREAFQIDPGENDGGVPPCKMS